jgi:non-homologous end joining protein Ku
VKESSVDADELSLAKQLIKGKTSKLDLSNYKDDYQAAVKKLVAQNERRTVISSGTTIKDPQCGQYHGCSSQQSFTGEGKEDNAAD